MEGAFDRSHTRAALEARTVDLALWRADFAQRMAERAEWLESRIDEPQQQVAPSKDGPQLVWVELSGRDAQAYMTAIGIAVDKINVLTRDESRGLASVDAWLRSLTGVDSAGAP